MAKRVSQIGNIRALAIFLVVLGHSIILYSSSWNIYTTDVAVPFLDAVKKFVDIPQMLLFFSLSGYLFVFTHGKKRGFGRLLMNKTLRLLVPYIGVGILFLMPVRLLIDFPSYQNLGMLEYAGNFLRANDVGHLWFLPALFIVFLLSELILTLAERISGIRKYPEIFLCAVAFGLYLQGYRIGFGYPPLLTAYSYLIWFSLGYLLNVHGVLVRRIYRFPLIKWGMLVVNLAGLVYCVQAENVRVLLSLVVKALCVVNAFGAMPRTTCDIVEKVDRNSFGVYLFHSPLIYITFANIPHANPAIVVFLNLVVFGAVAYGLTELIRRTKLKVLIGE